ncbi:MAG: single-stranded DNA-binding protein [Lachnospiraceae bacterium]|nr:single-stranded DNA-binding protein [Lachnospiraceae bacterium]
MNKVILIGRLTKDPNVTYSQVNGESRAIARYTLAVDRGFTRNNANGDQPTADFISCVAFGKTGEFAEKYLHKGTKIAVTGRIQTGSYTNKEGQKVYTTDVVVENHEFVESKNANGGGGSYSGGSSAPSAPDNDEDFMNIPGGIDDQIPFS